MGASGIRRRAGVGMVFAVSLFIVLWTAGVPFAEGARRTVAPLVVAYATEPSSLDGQTMNDEGSRIIYENIFEPLLQLRPDGSIAPLLATEYKAVSDTEWHLTIRSGVRFHNGQPFDVEAAVYSINRMVSPDFTTQKGSYVLGIVGAKIVDDRTIAVMTENVDPLLPLRLSAVVMVPPGIADDPAFSRNPVGTGPYRFVRWEPGRQIILERNSDYWGDPPQVPAAHFRFIPDRQTMLSALQAGEVDIVFHLLPEQLPLAPKAVSIPATEFSYIQLNAMPLDKFPKGKVELQDPRVRIALNLAIDKETLAKSIYLGHAQPNDAQRLSPGMVGYNPNVKAFPYDPERAKQLLAEAGYPNGFRLVLNVPTGRYLKGEETMEYVAAQLRAIGIETVLRRWEWTTYRTAARDKTEDPMDTKYGWNSSEWFDFDRSRSHYVCDGTSSKYCNEEVDRLFSEAASTLDQEARHRMYQRIIEIFHEDPPEIFLLQHNNIFGLSERVEWNPPPNATFSLRDITLLQ